MQLLLSGALFLLTLIAFSFSFYFLLKYRFEPLDRSYFYLFFTIILLCAWNLQLNLIDVLYKYQLLRFQALRNITLVFQIVGLIGLINITIILQKQLIHFLGFLTSQLSVFFFTINIAFLISDFYFQNFLYFNIVFHDFAYFEFDGLYALILLLGNLFLALTIINTFLGQRHVILQQYSGFMTIIIGIYTSLAALIPSLLLFAHLTFKVHIPIIIFSLLIFLVLPINAAILVYAAFTFPSFHVLGVYSIKQAILKGDIGYMLTYNNEEGPENALLSQPFMEKMGITNDDLFSFSIQAMTVLGSIDAGWEGLYLLPFSPLASYFAFSFNFITKNPSAQDPRLQSHTPVMLTVFISKTLHLKLSDLNSAFNELKRVTTTYHYIQEFLNEKIVMNIVLHLLKTIILL